MVLYLGKKLINVERNSKIMRICKLLNAKYLYKYKTKTISRFRNYYDLLKDLLNIQKFRKATINNNYKFSIMDMFLYLLEKNMKCPNVKFHNNSNENELLKITINNVKIYWPKHFNAEGIPWLYNEVFKKWYKNPSSYSHPYIKYNKYSWIIDAGVCEGFFSMLCLKKGAKKVFAIEPISDLINALKMTFKNEIKASEYQLITAALGEKNGFIGIEINNDTIWDSSCVPDNKKIEKVRMMRLDDICSKYNLRANGLIKMDIEGYEINALLGSGKLLREYKPNLAIAVYHKYENAKLCREIILKANPTYKVVFRGMYGYFYPPRPYILFAF